MPTLLRSLLLLIGLGLLLANCAKWKVESYDLVPQVKTGSATAPATTSVQVDCIVTELGPNTLQEFGIVYSSTNQLPTINDTKAKANGTTGTDKVMLNGLLPNTTYYYRTYATNNKGLTGYGDVQSFKTATVIADVRTLDLVGAPGQTSFQAQVQVANASAITIKEYGLVYSPTSQTPTTNDTKLVAAGTTGATVTLTIGSLQPNTTYYYRAYAITDGGVVSYGEAKQVKTGEPNPVAVTLDPVGTASTTAVSVQCQVTNASAIILKEYGVVYSPTSQTPTIADIKVPVSGTTGAAATVLLSPLVSNTTYYYRAYAIGSSGTPSYGDVKQAKTTVDILTTGAVSLTSIKPSVLDNTSATVTIKVEKPAGVTEYGIVLTPDPNQVSALMAGTAAPLRKSVTGAFPTTGTVDFVIKDLTENSPYYAVAFAKDATGATTFSKEVAAFQTKFGQRGNWRQLGSFPTQRAYVFNPMFTINGKVYAGSQATGASVDYYAFKQLYEYDPATNLWTQKKDFPATARSESTVAVVGNKAYILFGVTKGVYTSDAWEYDPATDNWRQLSTAPATKTGGQGIYNLQAGAIPYTLNGKVYAMFGRGPYNGDATLTNIYNSFYALDPAGTGTWDVTFPLNDKGLTNSVIYSAARSAAFSVQYGLWVYFGGGLVASAYNATGANLPYSTYFNSRQIWAYNIDTKELKQIALLPTTFNDCSNPNDSNGRMQNCAFIVGSKAYIIDCGYKTWVLDLTTNATPTAVTSLNNPNGTVGIGIGVNTKAYFGLRNADWWEFTP